MADCTASPDDAVRSCLERLRLCRTDIADALDGRSLRVALDFGDRASQYRITFTRDGHVMTRSGPVFRPHVELHAPPRQVARFLSGEVNLSGAVLDGIITLNISTAEAADYDRLRALVADVLAVGKVGATSGG